MPNTGGRAGCLKPRGLRMPTPVEMAYWRCSNNWNLAGRSHRELAALETALEQPTAEYLCTVCDIPLGLAHGVRGKGAPVSCFELALGVSGWVYLV